MLWRYLVVQQIFIDQYSEHYYEVGTLFIILFHHTA